MKCLLQARTAANDDLKGGSGGVISWDSNGTILPTIDGGRGNSVTDLAHEMFHGLDSNRGMLDNREEGGIKRSEWQAVYRENILRGQIGQPMRTHYDWNINQAGTFVGGTGTRIITSMNQPILPNWYRH